MRDPDALQQCLLGAAPRGQHQPPPRWENAFQAARVLDPARSYRARGAREGREQVLSQIEGLGHLPPAPVGGIALRVLGAGRRGPVGRFGRTSWRRPRVVRAVRAGRGGQLVPDRSPRTIKGPFRIAPKRPLIYDSFESGRQDLNLRPLDPQSSALPSCATSRCAVRGEPRDRAVRTLPYVGGCAAVGEGGGQSGHEWDIGWWDGAGAGPGRGGAGAECAASGRAGEAAAVRSAGGGAAA